MHLTSVHRSWALGIFMKPASYPLVISEIDCLTTYKNERGWRNVSANKST